MSIFQRHETIRAKFMLNIFSLFLFRSLYGKSNHKSGKNAQIVSLYLNLYKRNEKNEKNEKKSYCITLSDKIKNKYF